MSLEFSEKNPFKIWFALKILATGILIALMFITPTRTGMGEVYGWWLLLCVAWLILDYLIFVSADWSEVIDSVLIEGNSEAVGKQPPASDKFFFQILKVPLWLCIVISIVVGLAWGSIYLTGIISQQKTFLFVPDTFAIQPLSAGIDVRTFDAVVSSVGVAGVEEFFFSGLFFPTVWGVMAFIVYRFSGNWKFAFVLTFLLGAIFTGLIASYVFHIFAYSSGNVYAFELAFIHFTSSATITGLTGNIIAGEIAHAMHNFGAKIFPVYGTYESYPLLRAYFKPSDLDQNRFAYT